MVITILCRRVRRMSDEITLQKRPKRNLKEKIRHQARERLF